MTVARLISRSWRSARSPMAGIGAHSRSPRRLRRGCVPRIRRRQPNISRHRSERRCKTCDENRVVDRWPQHLPPWRTARSMLQVRISASRQLHPVGPEPQRQREPPVPGQMPFKGAVPGSDARGRCVGRNDTGVQKALPLFGSEAGVAEHPCATLIVPESEIPADARTLSVSRRRKRGSVIEKTEMFHAHAAPRPSLQHKRLDRVTAAALSVSAEPVEKHRSFREKTVRSRVKVALSLAVAAAGMFAIAAPAIAQQKTITVWCGKGFYKSEDDALLETIKKFEAKTGIKVELSQYAIQDMIPKTVAALDSGTVPDVAYSDTYDVQAQGKWAYRRQARGPLGRDDADPGPRSCRTRWKPRNSTTTSPRRRPITASR